MKLPHDNITVQSPSPMLNDKNFEQEVVKQPNYSDNERKYYGRVIPRIMNARDIRDESHDEFDGMNYLQRCEANLKGANTFVQPKKNKSDTNFVSGTIRQKIFAYLAAVSMLNLSPDIEAYDDKDRKWKDLGEAMEDVLFRLGELESEGGDEENKLLRQYQMMEQGEVFVRESFSCKYHPEKKIEGEFDGRLQSVSWKTVLKKIYEGPVRKIIPNENIILGNIHEYYMDNQPFVVDIELMPYEEAETLFRHFDRWQYVPRAITDIINSKYVDTKAYMPGKFYEGKKGEVEIVRYQDRFANEVQIFINGIMMLPIGMPMEFKTYDIVKQVNEVISSNFAYGKSSVFRLRNNVLLLDEMMRLALKKTQKSFAPPLANNTGKILSARIFDPGVVTTGLNPEKIKPLDPNSQPVSGGEFSMIRQLMENIDKNSVGQTFQGQQASGTQTATQILETQKQAKMMMGLTELTCSLLERKLAWLRIQNVLLNWMKPEKIEYDEYAKEWVKKYRSISREKFMEGSGIGEHIVRVSPEPPSEAEMQEEATILSDIDKKTGKVIKPVKISYMNPKAIEEFKMKFFVTVIPKERKSDALGKVLFNEFALAAMQFPDTNVRFLEERFAEHWEENPSKLFNQPKEEIPPEGAEAPALRGQAATGGPSAGVPLAPSPKNRSKLLDLTARTS